MAVHISVFSGPEAQDHDPKRAPAGYEFVETVLRLLSSDDDEESIQYLAGMSEPATLYHLANADMVVTSGKSWIRIEVLWRSGLLG